MGKKVGVLFLVACLLVAVWGCGSPTMSSFLDKEKILLDRMEPIAAQMEAEYDQYDSGKITYKQFSAKMQTHYDILSKMTNNYFAERKKVQPTNAERKDKELIKAYQYSGRSRDSLLVFVSWIINNPHEVKKDVDYIFKEEVKGNFHEYKGKFEQIYDKREK